MMSLRLPQQFTNNILDNCGLKVTGDISEEHIGEIFQIHDYIFYEVMIPIIYGIKKEITEED